VQSKKIKLTITPSEFFRGEISTAFKQQNLSVDENIEFYLVKLLCNFVSPVMIETAEGEKNIFDIPLALLLKQSLESEVNQKIKLLKTIGDTSLYISGYFQDYFNQRTFDINYYIDLGSQAYLSVASICRKKHQDEDFSSLYSNLSNNFKNYVEVIAEVSERTVNFKDQRVLDLYERWTKSQSERLRKKLIEEGILPSIGNKTKT
jgi:hypothetical protein